MRSAGSRTKLVVVVLAVLVLGAGTVLYVRSRGDDTPSATELARRQPGCDRLRRFSSSVEEVSFAAPAAAPAAAAGVLSRMGGELDELASSAPSGVRDDVRDLIGALRATSNDPAATRSARFVRAQQGLQDYLADPANGCQAGSESESG